MAGHYGGQPLQSGRDRIQSRAIGRGDEPDSSAARPGQSAGDVGAEKITSRDDTHQVTAVLHQDMADVTAPS
jgi:hypothetical protein